MGSPALLVRFHEPEPLVHAPGDLAENVGAVRVLQIVLRRIRCSRGARAVLRSALARPGVIAAGCGGASHRSLLIRVGAGFGDPEIRRNGGQAPPRVGDVGYKRHLPSRIFGPSGFPDRDRVVEVAVRESVDERNPAAGEAVISASKLRASRGLTREGTSPAA